MADAFPGHLGYIFLQNAFFSPRFCRKGLFRAVPSCGGAGPFVRPRRAAADVRGPEIHGKNGLPRDHGNEEIAKK